MKKKLTILLVVVMAFTSFVGCGSNMDNEGTSKEGGNVISNSDESDEKPVLTFICSSEFEATNPLLGDIDELFSLFPDKAPNVTVNVEYVPFAELDQKLLLSNAGGNYYDIVLVNNSSLSSLAEAGVIGDMSSYLEKDNMAVEDIFVNAMAKASKYKDGVYAFPWNTDTRVLAVNKTMLNEAGITEMPKTKEDMLDIAKKVTKDLDGDGTNDQFGYTLNISRSMPCVYYQGNWMVANGIHVYEEADEFGKYVNNMNSPEGIDYFNWLSEMGNYIPNDMISYDNAMIENAFASGKFAMYTYGTWMIGKTDFEETAKENNVEYELILNPEGLNGNASTSGGWMLGVSPQCENMDAAWEFIKFMITPEVNAKLCEVSGLPAVQGSYELAPFNDSKYDIYKEQLKTSEMAVSAFIPQFPEIVDAYGENAIATIIHKKTPEEAAKDAQDKINAILKENGYQE